MKAITFLYKAFRKAWRTLWRPMNHARVRLLFAFEGVRHGSFRSAGVPLVSVARHSRGITIGDGFAMNNGTAGNPIGCTQPCMLIAGNDASISIGRNVGISQTALVAMADITIKNNVKMGGGYLRLHFRFPLVRL